MNDMNEMVTHTTWYHHGNFIEQQIWTTNCNLFDSYSEKAPFYRGVRRRQQLPPSSYSHSFPEVSVTSADDWPEGRVVEAVVGASLTETGSEIAIGNPVIERIKSTG